MTAMPLPLVAFCRTGREILALVSVTFVLSIAPAFGADAQSAAKSAQPTFATPDEAFAAITEAAKNYDRATLLKLLGPGAKRIVDSGDPVADRESGRRFADSYAQKHSVQMDGDAKATLIVGADDWPQPIPVVKDGQRWRFDARAGEEEILARRIGRNELAAIQVCLAYVDAQKDFASVDRNGDGVLEYARKFVSSPGKHDGLYWPTNQGDPPSPLGPAFARARAEGYGDKPGSCHGYRYKILTAQGKSAPGGARDYIVKGRLIGGFALVAYPTRFGDSGVMTFVCNQEGVVYEKDLGSNTTEVAKKMTRFDPDASWKKVPQ
jgi:Protein of unknown function (DUF2950)